MQSASFANSWPPSSKVDDASDRGRVRAWGPRAFDSLSAAGVPIYGGRGRNGGFQLREGWRTQPTGLTAGEARALFMTGLPGPAQALGLGEAAASAHLKLLATLPDDWRGDAERVSARFHLDPVDWFRASPPADHLRLVAEAVWNERRVRMMYESWTAVTERVVEPLGLVLKGSALACLRPTGGAR
jgi:predicted DNA-binding transcriptional regulator YafY